jgi:hypothetical protein
MYYQFIIMQLFRPLVGLRIIESQVSPRDICLEAARAIQNLLTSYSQLYTLKRVPSFMPYFVLTSSITQLTIIAATVQASGLKTTADPQVSELLKQGIDSLAEMTPCHRIAKHTSRIICFLAKKWNINVDVNTDAALSPEEYESVFKPFAGSLNAFVPTMIIEDSIFHRSTEREAEEKTIPQLEKTAESEHDPSLWPFLMQRQAMLSKGEELEEAGFAVL